MPSRGEAVVASVRAEESARELRERYPDLLSVVTADLRDAGAVGQVTEARQSVPALVDSGPRPCGSQAGQAVAAGAQLRTAAGKSGAPRQVPADSFDSYRRRLRRKWSRPIHIGAGSVLARMLRYSTAHSGPGRHQPS